MTDFPAERPAGLRRRSLRAGTELWRIDAQPADQWKWDTFPHPRYRFDSAAGLFRTRYAAASIVGAARERYEPTGLYLPADHAGQQLVRLVTRRPLRVFDLRTEAHLEILGLDDRISTGHEPEVWHTSQALADAVRRWWDDLDGITYRSRTTPESSANLAFFALDGFTATSRRLADCSTELDELVLQHHFTVGFDC